MIGHGVDHWVAWRQLVAFGSNGTLQVELSLSTAEVNKCSTKNNKYELGSDVSYDGR